MNMHVYINLFFCKFFLICNYKKSSLYLSMVHVTFNSSSCFNLSSQIKPYLAHLTECFFSRKNNYTCIKLPCFSEIWMVSVKTYSWTLESIHDFDLYDSQAVRSCITSYDISLIIPCKSNSKNYIFFFMYATWWKIARFDVLFNSREKAKAIVGMMYWDFMFHVVW